MSELVKDDAKYYQNPAISQSGIKLFLESPVEFYNSYVIKNVEAWDSPALRFGRLYHTYILEPNKVDKKYVYCNIQLVPNIKKLVDDTILFNDFDKAYEKSDYAPKNKEKYKELIKTDKKILKYLEFLNSTKEKAVITKEELDLCENMKLVLVNTPILRKSLFKEDFGIETFVEYEIFDTLFGIPVKAKIDKITISHNVKRILIFDLKTTSNKNMEDFKESIIKYGYNVQSAFYSHLVKLHFKELIDKGYTVEFLFVPQKSSAPYQFLGLVKLSEENNLLTFQTIIKPALEEINVCLKTNKWVNDYRYVNTITII